MLNLNENLVLHLLNFPGMLLYRKSLTGVTGLIDAPLQSFDFKLFPNEELFILINKMVCCLEMPSVS